MAEYGIPASSKAFWPETGFQVKETKTAQSCNKTLNMLHNSWYTDMVSFEQHPQFIQTGTCFLGHVRVIIVVFGSRLVKLQQQTGKCERQWARRSHLGCVLYISSGYSFFLNFENLQTLARSLESLELQSSCKEFDSLIIYLSKKNTKNIQEHCLVPASCDETNCCSSQKTRT